MTTVAGPGEAAVEAAAQLVRDSSRVAGRPPTSAAEVSTRSAGTGRGRVEPSAV